MRSGPSLGPVANAKSDEEVAAWLHTCNPDADFPRLSRLLLRLRVKDATDDLREDFLKYYGYDNDPERLIVDILEEDDSKSFAAT